MNSDKTVKSRNLLNCKNITWVKIEKWLGNLASDFEYLIYELLHMMHVEKF